ncbi:MAG: tetratricopeptide repeat protein [Candidatus Eisenbacteria bacterium]|nr:tetratricopeptide repeat protein [Candidatus Eisenbacteria bacterium]
MIHEAIGDELGLAYVLATRSRAESSIAGQRPRLLEALSLATSAGDELLIATLKENLALTHQAERQFDEATALHEDALRLFQTLADATGQANVYANLASLHAQMGHTALSKQHATQSAAILRTIDLDGNDAPPDALARLWGLQAVIFEQQGDTDSAAEAYETSLSILDLHPYPMTRAEVLVNYGGFKLASGDTIDAERILNEAEGLVTRFLAGTNSRVEATLEAVMARVAAVRGDLDAAATHYQNAIAIFAEYGDDGASARQMLSLAELITEPGAFVEFIAAAKTLAEATGPLSADFEANALLLQYQSIATDDDKPALATRLLELAGDTSVPWPIQVDILVTIQTDHLEITGRLGPVTSRLSDLHEDDSLSPVQELRVNRQLARIAAASGDPRDAVEFARRSLELVDAAEGFERVDIRIEAGRILTQSGEIDEGFDAMFTGFLDGQSSGLFDFDADDVATQSAGEAELSGAIREVVLAHVNEVAAIEVLLARVELITSRPLGLIAESNFGDIAWELETLRWHRDNPDE